MLLNDTPLVEVDKFTYLGSIVINNGNIDAEISKRIQSTTSAFEKLEKSSVEPERNPSENQDESLKNYRNINTPV